MCSATTLVAPRVRLGATHGPADAVLWVGCTPPPLQYFSMRSYLTGYKMANVFGSLGDAANNLRFNSSGGGTSPANFNRTAALIVSGDLGSGARVADAAGVLHRAEELRGRRAAAGFCVSG